MKFLQNMLEMIHEVQMYSINIYINLLGYNKRRNLKPIIDYIMETHPFFVMAEF